MRWWDGLYVFGANSVRLSDIGHIVGCFYLVAGFMGWPDIAVAVVARQFPRNEMFYVPSFANLYFLAADMASTA
ncbi:putative predicted protein [Rhizobium favelukesii]|uniref:Uncharacterized protein n=1 Tax=Rhizobium favelukesii TaxID=348824 RepID=W6R9N2_9HYPH|nr:hypothetical protein [Rhizobium favelukesii]CDM57634.1 putative predicted protein [Rhizobium favelukesii]